MPGPSSTDKARRIRVKRIAATLAACLLASPALAQSAPDAVVRGIYEAYVTAEKAGKDAPDILRPSIYSERVRARITKLEKACAARPNDLCLPDADFIIDGQDYRISAIATRLVSQKDDRATVEARFRNFGKPSTKTYALVREQGRWVVDDIDGGLMELLEPLPASP